MKRSIGRGQAIVETIVKRPVKEAVKEAMAEEQLHAERSGSKSRQSAVSTSESGRFGWVKKAAPLLGLAAVSLYLRRRWSDPLGSHPDWEDETETTMSREPSDVESAEFGVDGTATSDVADQEESENEYTD